jgi:hypothetical protein
MIVDDIACPLKNLKTPAVNFILLVLIQKGQGRLNS